MWKRLIVAAVILTAVAAGVYANMNRTPRAVAVRVESAARRDLASLVTGSGQIRPFKEVDISSNVMGRITRLSIEEGQEVTAGEFLLRIDPVRYLSAVQQVEASIAGAETSLELAKQDLEYRREVLDRREGLYRQDLLSEEVYQESVQAAMRAERDVQLRTQDIQRLRAQLDQTQHDLSQVEFTSPINGVITRLNVEEGETAVTGTMNNPGTVLLTIADLSVVEAEIEIDETDIVHVQLGQAAEVRIDAFPDQVFRAEVTEVGRSPINTAAAAASQAINFKVVVRLLDPVIGARPGLSCTADITTATREQVLTVPIQALILREVQLDEEGRIVERDPVAELLAELESDNGDDEAASELQEIEGAFVIRDGEALFLPIEVGIAGERHFEVLSGLEEDDQVVTGPFSVIRTLQTGERVEIERATRRDDAAGSE